MEFKMFRKTKQQETKVNDDLHLSVNEKERTAAATTTAVADPASAGQAQPRSLSVRLFLGGL